MRRGRGAAVGDSGPRARRDARRLKSIRLRPAYDRRSAHDRRAVGLSEIYRYYQSITGYSRRDGKRRSRDMKLLMAMPIPFPPFDTQQRIAGMLNRAARIVRLREKANDRIRECAPALFVKMFGDPEENSMGWPEYPFGNLVTDMTKSVTKIPKTHYNEAGIFPIIDQGKASVAGYTDDREGCFAGPLPAIVFGDHTRRFKLVRSRFFLGADGTKLLLPDTVDLDPVFLFGNLLCVSIEDAGYSRHFKYLKEKNLILPPLDRQLQFRDLLESIERIDSAAETAAKAASVLTAALTARLLERAFARPLRERARTKEMEEMKP